MKAGRGHVPHARHITPPPEGTSPSPAVSGAKTGAHRATAADGGTHAQVDKTPAPDAVATGRREQQWQRPRVGTPHAAIEHNPEFWASLHPDNGCYVYGLQVSDSCLTCPLAQCKHDVRPTPIAVAIVAFEREHGGPGTVRALAHEGSAALAKAAGISQRSARRWFEAAEEMARR